MLSTRIDRGRIIFLGLALAMIPALAAFAPSDEPGALAKDPQGWIDMLATAGSELDGWTRKPIPPEAELNPEVAMVARPDESHPDLSGQRRP